MSSRTDGFSPAIEPLRGATSAVAAILPSSRLSGLRAPAGMVAWELRPVLGPARFMALPVRTVTDVLAGAQSRFAEEISASARDVGVETTWLIDPGAAAALDPGRTPPGHLAVLLGLAQCVLRDDRLTSFAVSASAKDAPILNAPAYVVDVRPDGRGALRRYDAGHRALGRVRLITDLGGGPAELFRALGPFPATEQAGATVEWFWEQVNPVLADPLVRPAGDSWVAGAAPHWNPGSKDMLFYLVEAILWMYLRDPDAYPVRLSLSARTPASTARIAYAADLPRRACDLLARALAENEPVGWSMTPRAKPASGLTRRSDWDATAHKFDWEIPAPSAHERLLAEQRLALWMR